jgi:hypothetical protein
MQSLQSFMVTSQNAFTLASQGVASAHFPAILPKQTSGIFDSALPRQSPDNAPNLAAIYTASFGNRIEAKSVASFHV